MPFYIALLSVAFWLLIGDDDKNTVCTCIKKMHGSTARHISAYVWAGECPGNDFVWVEPPQGLCLPETDAHRLYFGNTRHNKNRSYQGGIP